jgi:sulfur transfer complex TusBCD TusB component (DsrH family)
LRKILYLVKDSTPVRPDLLRPDQRPDREESVVLLQGGVTLTDLPTNHVYALSEDVRARHITPPYPVISYRDLLRMMFEADVVIAL